MSTFLDTLRQRMTEAQSRAASAQKALQDAQNEHTSAMRDYESWSRAFEAESKREGISVAKTVMVEISTKSPDATTEDAEGTERNKTELIRDVIKQHPAGVTPGEIWSTVKNQIPRRNYVYAVLGRLKDRDQVSVRNGKYRIKIVPAKENGEINELGIQ